MAFLARSQLEALGLKALGHDVRISERAVIHNPALTEIGDHSRIDDFCVVSGVVKIGRNVHLAVFCNVAGGTAGIEFHDFAGFAYGVHAFSQTDDYSGRFLTNPTVPSHYKSEVRKRVLVGRHCIVGTGSVLFPGVELGEGSSVGAMSLVTKSTEPWFVYFGVPARKLRPRRRDLLELEAQYLGEEGDTR